MKGSRKILMLMAAMLLALLCCAGVLAEPAADTVYELYPVVDGGEQPPELECLADFKQDVVITFTDLRYKYGKLAVVDCSSFSADTEDVQAVWDQYPWKLGGSAETYNDKDTAAFQLGDYSDIPLNGDYALELRDGRTVTYRIESKGLTSSGLMDVTLVFYAGSDPDNLRPVWKGKFYDRDSYNDFNTPVEAQNLTLSAIQMRASDSDEWRDALPEDTEPESIQVRAMAEFSVLEDKDYQDNTDIVFAKRWIDCWTPEEGKEPFVLRAVADDKADGTKEYEFKRPEPVEAPEPVEEPKPPQPKPEDGQSPEPIEKEPLALTLTGGEKDVLLASEDADGHLQAESKEPLVREPGKYALVVSGDSEDELTCAVSVDGEAGEAQPIPNDEKGLALEVEAGKSYTLSVQRDEETVEIELEGARPEQAEIAIDAVSLESNGAKADLGDVCINIENRNNGDKLIFSGTAQDGAKLSWELIIEGNLFPLASGDLTASADGKWEIGIDLGDDAFKNCEGEPVFEIRYAETTDDPKAAPQTRKINIDTKAPEGYVEFEVDGVTRESDGVNPCVFEQGEDQILVHIGEVRGGKKQELAFSSLAALRAYSAKSEDDATNADGATLSEVRVTDEDGVIAITCVLRDEAGNAGEVKAYVRVVSRIGIDAEGVTLDGEPLAAGAWIGAAHQGKTLVVTGTGEPGEALEWRFYADSTVLKGDAEPVWVQDEADENGIWTAEYALTEDLAAAESLSFEIRYEDEALASVEAPEALSWKVDMVAPTVPKVTLVGSDGIAACEFVAGDRIGVEISDIESDAQVGGATLAVGDRVETVEPDAWGDYAFVAESGSCILTVAAVDQAGNASESTVKFEVARKITVKVASEVGRPFNAAEMADGLRFSIDADEGRELSFQCALVGNGAKSLNSAYDEVDKTCAVTLIDPPNEYNFNGGGPVELELHVAYKGLDAAKFGSACEASFDLWTPRKPTVKVATTGNASTASEKYFDSEPIVVKVTGLEAGATAAATANGDQMPEGGGEAYADLTGAVGEPSDDAVYFVLEGGCSEDELSIVVTCADEAGNAVDASVTLKRIEMDSKSKSKNVKVTVEGTLSPAEDSSVMVKGNNGMAYYYLVSDDVALAGRRIPVSNSGSWELELKAADLERAQNIEGDTWHIKLNYPSDAYAIDPEGNSTTVAVEVPVDITCKLEWAEPLKLGATSIHVSTDPRAMVRLFVQEGELDEGSSVSVTADPNGDATFKLSSPITRDTIIRIEATDEAGNTAQLSNEAGVEGELDHAALTAEFEQVGTNAIRAHGTGEPNFDVVLSVDGRPTKCTVDASGAFEATAEVDEAAASVELALKYDVFGDAPITRTFEMDRTPPALEIDQQIILDIGGEVSLASEQGAVIAFTGTGPDAPDGRDILQVTMGADRETVLLPKLEAVTRIEARATDVYGNVSDPVALEVVPAPRVMAGFDRPEDGAALDSEGRVTLAGWVAAAEDAAPEGLVLEVAQNGTRSQHAMGGSGAEIALIRSEESGEADEQLMASLSGQMDAHSVWRFEYELALGDWNKGDIEVSVQNADETFDSRGFVSRVDEGRKLRYILFCAAALAGLAACLALVWVLSKRIRRISDGRVDPDSGMSKLTERSRQQADK